MAAVYKMIELRRPFSESCKRQQGGHSTQMNLLWAAQHYRLSMK
jgi:hypothetical protein